MENSNLGQIVIRPKAIKKPIHVFPVEPVAAPRMTQGQIKLTKIPDRKLDKEKLAIKTRIKRYLTFKNNMKLLIKMSRFDLPSTGIHIVFKISTKDTSLHGRYHHKKPDMSNFLKAFEDCFGEDKHVADYRVTKVWAKTGQIEIYNLWG